MSVIEELGLTLTRLLQCFTAGLGLSQKFIENISASKATNELSLRSLKLKIFDSHFDLPLDRTGHLRHYGHKNVRQISRKTGGRHAG